MAYSWGDIHTWLSDEAEDRVFRMWVFKRMFTPYEQEKNLQMKVCTKIPLASL